MTTRSIVLTVSPADDMRGDPQGVELLRLILLAKLGRLLRWEFWPAWIVYLFLLPHFLTLALRHKSLTVFTSANPGMPLGGFVGESKYDILQKLPSDWIVPSDVLEALPIPTDSQTAIQARITALDHVLVRREWTYPLVLKPDIGERGSGVALVRSRAEAIAYLTTFPHRLVVQTYHPGPFETGVFYVRRPGEARGYIFSITDKHLPAVLGNGATSLRGLIWRHPRLRMQARTLLESLGDLADRIPTRGERVPLSIAGNHCRGTMFLDGGKLMTDALTASIDSISRQYEGFYFGRFDIRYSDPEAFARGEGFRIVELNGVLSESTNIYDPAWPLRRALGTLREQWTLAFAIGAGNAARGAARASLSELVRAALEHRRD